MQCMLKELWSRLLIARAVDHFWLFHLPNVRKCRQVRWMGSQENVNLEVKVTIVIHHSLDRLLRITFYLFDTNWGMHLLRIGK